jgi:hypothetical protein
VPEQTLPFVRLQLKKKPPNPTPVEKLIDALDADKFEDRERAEIELGKRGADIRPQLEKALERAKPETRRRIENVLERLRQSPWSVDELRALRAVEMLEHIGTPAKELLGELIKEAPAPLWSRESEAARSRLNRMRNP